MKKILAWLNIERGPLASLLIILATALIVTVIGLLILSGCAPSESAIQTAIALTEAAKPTATHTPLPTETFTPIPPTSTFTPVPTDTPIPPTNTPVFEVFTPQQVIDAFKAAGLEVGATTPMTKDDYGMAPMVATSGIHMLIPSMCSDCGGRIFTFANYADQAILQAYYVELGRSSAAFFSWVFVHDNILVQINGDLPEAKAMEYKAALESMEP